MRKRWIGTIYTKSCMFYIPLNSYSDDAVWDVVLALWAVKFGLRNGVGTIGTRFQRFLNLTCLASYNESTKQ